MAIQPGNGGNGGCNRGQSTSDDRGEAFFRGADGES